MTLGTFSTPLCVFWYSMVSYISVRYSSVRYGTVWYLHRPPLAVVWRAGWYQSPLAGTLGCRLGGAGTTDAGAAFSMVHTDFRTCRAQYRMVRYGIVWYGMVRYGAVWYGTDRVHAVH